LFHPLIWPSQFLFHFKKDPHLTAIGLTFIDTYGKITSGSNELIREVTGLGSMYQLLYKNVNKNPSHSIPQVSAANSLIGKNKFVK
jgi:hypothetical protein